MPLTPKYPGVYVQETPSRTHAISGATTADTAFVGVFEQGPANRPAKITNFGQFTSTFGPLNPSSKATYGISQFFQNGGRVAWVVRIRGENDNDSAGSTAHVSLEAIGPGTWGDQIQIATQAAADGAFDLVVRRVSDPTGTSPTVVDVETYAAVNASTTAPNYVGDAIAHRSLLVKMAAEQPSPAAAGNVAPVAASILDPAVIGDVASPAFEQGQFSGGQDDLTVSGADALGSHGNPSNGVLATGMYTLDSIAPEMFNILCIPAMAAFDRGQWNLAYTAASNYCAQMGAFLIVDPPTSEISATDEGGQVRNIQAWWSTVGESGSSDHAATYFPRINIPDPVTGNPMETEVSGTLAGVYATTDASRGVWKAPAGRAAVLSNVLEPVVRVGDSDNATLNEFGINCLRAFSTGTVSWGARTVDGSHLVDSPWKYINVRRLALYIEASLELGTRWAAFEPNAEPLWASLRLSVGSFMSTLYMQGAFVGSSAKDSYFVACDATTTTPFDIQEGRLNISVGFAPLYPAEFVVITISQMINR